MKKADVISDPPIVEVICEALEKHPRVMGIVMGVIMHPILSAILLRS